MGQRLTPAYAAVMTASTPIVRTWGRMTVSGLEHLPETGPVLLAGNHDSYWDPIAIGLAARPVRQIRALAKDSLWKPVVGPVLDGMGQIPIARGKTDTVALARAIEELQRGTCIGIFPEGTRSLGRELRARSGFGRLSDAVPEAEIVCVTVIGTTDIPRFPKRPRIAVRFFRPRDGGRRPGESAAELGARLLAEMREEAPRVAAGRKGRRPAEPAA